MQRRQLVRVLSVILGASALCAVPAQAQQIQRPIKIVVGFPPGGTADAVARMFGDELQKRLGVSVVVDNKPGAGGMIAAETFRRLPADGSTLLFANSHMMTTLPLTSKSVKYDPLKDFEPVARLANFELALAVSGASQATNFKEYVALAKAQQNARSYGIPAAGSAPQFIGYVVGTTEKVDLMAVPYKGGAPLMNDLMGNQLPAAVDALGGMIELHRAGKVRIVAVTGVKRHPAIPAVPTFTELGYTSLDQPNWVGLFAPVGTPAAYVDQVNAAVKDIAASPAIIEKLGKIGFDAAAGSPQEMRDVVKNDLATWGPIIKKSGFQLD